MEIKEALEHEQNLRGYFAGTHTRPGSAFEIPALLAIIDDLRGGHADAAQVREVVSAYHANLPMLPKVSVLSQPRTKKIITQWKAAQKGKPPNMRQTLVDFWTHIFKYAAQSDFLTGKRANDRGWLPTIDFFLQASSLTKLREGAYHGQQARSNNNAYWV